MVRGCFVASLFFLTCFGELLGWGMLSGDGELDTDPAMVHDGVGRALPSFSGN